MKNQIQFKVHGVNKLLTYDQLLALEHEHRIGTVRVIDTQTQHNWKTNFKTVVAKFR